MSNSATVEITDDLMLLLGRCLRGHDVSTQVAALTDDDAWQLIGWAALFVANREGLQDEHDRFGRLAELVATESNRRRTEKRKDNDHDRNGATDQPRTL